MLKPFLISEFLLHSNITTYLQQCDVSVDHQGTAAKATWLSSVAMKENASDAIEVRLAEGHLQVLRNQKVLPFTEQRWMDLHGEMITTLLTSCTLDIVNFGSNVDAVLTIELIR